MSLPRATSERCTICGSIFIRKHKSQSKTGHYCCSAKCKGMAAASARKPETRDDLIARVKSRILLDANGCWLWTGTKNRKGYGQISVGNWPKAAHRLSYELFVGPLNNEQWLCHKCDVPACVNPDHLFLGDVFANKADQMAKWRHPHGGDHHSAKLSDNLVADLRSGRLSTRDVMEITGADKSSVWAAKTGRTWSHLPGGSSK
jgi:hypothetical protein